MVQYIMTIPFTILILFTCIGVDKASVLRVGAIPPRDNAIRYRLKIPLHHVPLNVAIPNLMA